MLGILILTSSLGLVACDRRSPTPVLPTMAPPTPVVRDRSDSEVPASLAPTPVPTLVRVAPAASAVLTYTLTAVEFPEPLEGRPGPWSPDGQALVAYAGGPRDRGAWSGRLWIVDVRTGRPRWDSGDVMADPAREAAAAWMADGSLALARSDGMFVDAAGQALDSPAGITGQPRQVFPDPSGRRLLATGPEGAWLVQPGGAARFLSGWPPAGQASWSWSPDGQRLILGRTDGRYVLIDALTGESSRVAEGFERPEADGMPEPRWLADGRLLLTAARELRYLDGAEFDHRLLDPLSTAASSLVETLGIARNPVRPVGIDRAVSPDGRYILYPEYGPESDGGPPRATWMLDLVAGRVRSIAPISGAIHWSPTSSRFAVFGQTGLDLYDPEMGPVLGIEIPDAPAGAPSWSPDGRWLLVSDSAAGLWLIAADGGASPLRIAQRVIWPPTPSWSPSGDRFAVSVASDPGLQASEPGDASSVRLVLMTVGKESRP